jgi:hypothetical protein
MRVRFSSCRPEIGVIRVHEDLAILDLDRDSVHPSRGGPGKVDAQEVELLTMRGFEHIARSTEENAFP